MQTFKDLLNLISSVFFTEIFLGFIGMAPLKVILMQLLIFSVCHSLHAQQVGLVPDNRNGFETGDWRNFRPHYVGDAQEFIRPNFMINDTNPISGNYSLRWQGNDKEQEWMKISNAFYLKRPIEISVDLRVNTDSDDWAAGLYLMETYHRYTGIRIKPRGNRLDVSLKDLTGKTTPVDMISGQVLRLTVMLNGRENIKAILSDTETSEILAELDGFSGVKPEALGMYVYTEAGSETIIDFDDLVVESAPYRMKSGEWARSPHFVILPQLPDVTEDQGNWVGAQSTMKKDGEYLMWYRRRDNVDRGKGYGFARSNDGIHWNKFDENPVFTYDSDLYSSSEKIQVLYVDGLYRAWYAVNAPGNWYTAYATSKDGLTWEKHGLVLNDTYTKDVDVVYHNERYYLYSIKDNDEIGIYSSSNGMEWEYQDTIPMGVHRHVAVTFVEESNEFQLYASGGFAGVSQAISKDGVNFGPFIKVMDASRIGLDDWADYGVTYLSFLTDEHGKIEDDREMPIYYQARNTWDNNIPGWLFHGSERIVLAGHYEGIFLGVITTVLPEGGYEYHSFPFEVPRADGIEIHASHKVEIQMDTWKPYEEILGKGSIKTPNTVFGHSGEVNIQVQWDIQNLEPGGLYELIINQIKAASEQADDQGSVLFTAIVESDTNISFSIHRKQYENE